MLASLMKTAQCTLFPYDSIRMEYVNSIFAPAVITGEFGDTGAVLVGISNGRLHLDKKGNYNLSIKPNIVTFSDVLNDKSTKKADAIYEVYAQGVPAIGSH